MPTIDLKSFIAILSEKRLQNGPSKGREQWQALVQFDGRTVGEFFEHAATLTINSLGEKFQSGRWWERELR